MLKLGWILGLVLLMGCSTVQVPKYVQAKHPYIKRVYGSYEQTLAAVRNALKESGLVIESEVSPSIYEYNNSSEFSDKRQVLIISTVEEIPYFLGTRYSRMNVYVREGNMEQCEIEIRYMKVNSLTIKGFYGYKYKRITRKIFDSVERNLAGNRMDSVDIDQTLK